MIRIIANKKIDLTNDEFTIYQNICKSYDRVNFKGSDLFLELFETDEKGIIVLLKPPTTYTSMEVFMFLSSVMLHQHIRQMYGYVDTMCISLREKQKELDAKMAQLDSLLEKAAASK